MGTRSKLQHEDVTQSMPVGACKSNINSSKERQGRVGSDVHTLDVQVVLSQSISSSTSTSDVNGNASNRVNPGRGKLDARRRVLDDIVNRAIDKWNNVSTTSIIVNEGVSRAQCGPFTRSQRNNICCVSGVAAVSPVKGLEKFIVVHVGSSHSDLVLGSIRISVVDLRDLNPEPVEVHLPRFRSTMSPRQPMVCPASEVGIVEPLSDELVVRVVVVGLEPDLWDVTLHIVPVECDTVSVTKVAATVTQAVPTDSDLVTPLVRLAKDRVRCNLVLKQELLTQGSVDVILDRSGGDSPGVALPDALGCRRRRVGCSRHAVDAHVAIVQVQLEILLSAGQRGSNRSAALQDQGLDLL
mmetsp:Transcript_19171/g.39525  ORF Transcript_19171/g.39525 Transcript_19171/m.39525 type:complete len:354 (+) Transcript_19171:1037-2098(+)